MNYALSEWKTAPLGELSRTTSGGTPSRKRKDFYNGTIPWVKSGELNDDYIEKTEEQITEEALRNSSAKLFPAGTLLIALYGATVGKTSILRIDASTNQAICGITPGPELDTEYLRYHLMFRRRELLGHRYGGAQPNISQQIIRNLSVAYSSLSEQKKIAHVLSTVQRAIEAQERIIQSTTELKKALMHKLFTEGTRGEPQKQTEIGPVPESWEVVELVRFAQFKNGINFTKNQKGDKGVLTIDVLNMYGHNCTASLENLYRVNKQVSSDYLLKAGDLLFVRSSLKLEGVGWTSLFDGCSEPATFCGFIIRARLNDSEIFCPRFLTNYFRTDTARKILISGGARVAITNINQGMLKSFPIPKPSLTEQQQITATINNIDYKTDQHRKKLTALQDLFRTLLHGLMTAKIRVERLGLKGKEALACPLKPGQVWM